MAKKTYARARTRKKQKTNKLKKLTRTRVRAQKQKNKQNSSKKTLKNFVISKSFFKKQKVKQSENHTHKMEKY